jgi:hypothetical protein
MKRQASRYALLKNKFIKTPASIREKEYSSAVREKKISYISNVSMTFHVRR